MNATIRNLGLAAILVALPPSLTGCRSIYYGTMEKLGYHKRDLLVDRVEDARDAQEDAKEQFQTALDRFSAVLNIQGGDLQAKYDKLSAEFKRSESKAQAVHSRIAAVEDVGQALFREWKAELDQYTSHSLRQASQIKFDQTRRQFDRLIGAMKRAEQKVDPVLSAFRDQVLFLKHNLNAQAISSLQGELISIETDIAALIRDMDDSIREANAFISSMDAE